MQSALWDQGGLRANLRPSPDPYPAFPVLPYLQRLEHSLLRPIAHIFDVPSVAQRAALMDPPAERLFNDDPVWMPHKLWDKELQGKVQALWNQTNTEINEDERSKNNSSSNSSSPRTAVPVYGRCVWWTDPSFPGGLDGAARPASGPSGCPFQPSQMHTLSMLLQQREAEFAASATALRQLLVTVCATCATHAACAACNTRTILVLRNTHYMTGRRRDWNVLIGSSNSAARLLAASYGLPFADLGTLPSDFSADGVHIKRGPAMQYINLIINIFKQASAEREGMES